MDGFPSLDAIRLTREQVRQVDRIAIEEYEIPGMVLMENAGRGCVDLLQSLGIGGPVAICCGPGNNGGDGFVIARHLQLRGFESRILLVGIPDRLRGDAEANFRIVQHCDIPVTLLSSWDRPTVDGILQDADWIVDALLGTGASGEPRSPLDQLIPHLNQFPARRLAVDMPSGLDCDSGSPASNTFRADHTCTFVASKVGFDAAAAKAYLGDVHVLDIGAPRRIIDKLLTSSADFTKS
ncbi:MAG: NAD(P)H-hydrate epimerase [Planctomycetaceae bacterium]|nr:MAG: NAD(P)H-hydrate epimerase [Planctomycetaceae bacterium]